MQTKISIHVPHAGDDYANSTAFCDYDEFQSTSPTRGTTHDQGAQHLADGISIHVPHAGDDCRSYKACDGPSQISIHVPHAGDDGNIQAACISVIISIHVPHAGDDHEIDVNKYLWRLFQSTSPTRGTTNSNDSLKSLFNISIHVPHAGDDSANVAELLDADEDFNPRPPRGGRLCKLYRLL